MTRPRALLCHRASATLCCILAFSLSTGGSIARGATPEEVDNAIKKGQAFLYKQQKPTGGWENDAERKGKEHDWEHMQGGTFGGFTAIATYALLASGENAQESRVVKAVQFLKKADVVGIYALGLRCQVWLLIPQTAEVRTKVEHDKQLLISSMFKQGNNAYLWDYTPNKGGRIDHSVSQYGVLGLWACQQAGVEVPRDVWDGIEKRWRQQQYNIGGWAYDGDGKDSKNVTASMTAAGVATLFITQDYLHDEEGLNCGGNVNNDAIENGLRWMGEHFGQVGDTYSLYGTERIGVASGYKYFGTTDWFKDGAERLVRSQAADGSWTGGYPGSTPVPSTSFALLFLSRGRAPVMMNKLNYTINRANAKPLEGHWNERPRDVANLARWCGARIESDLNWQIVNLQVPASELHDAPILYISGDESLRFSDAEIAKLREFIEGGGMIVGNPDCGKPSFAESFEKLGSKMFKYEFRDLPPSHVLFTQQQFYARNWKSKPVVRGLSNGVRELMLLLPDVARAWQTRADATRKESFELGADIFEYAVDKKGLNVKGKTHIVLDNPAIQPTRTVKLARLDVGDNWNPEPGGWRRLASILHNDFKVGVTVETVKPVPGKLAGFKVAHLTGTTKFQFTDEERIQLLEFVRHGGTLIVDATGGSSDFADAAEAELKTIFGKEAATGLASTVPLDHPVYQLPGAKIENVAYRVFARKTLVGNAKAPRVHAIEHAGKVVAFYSREDLSTGIVGEQVDGVLGYDPATATAIMRNLVLYAAFGAPPTTKPTAAAAH